MASYTVQSTTELLQNYIGKHLGTDFRLLLGLSKETIDPWEMSENRYNVLLTVALRFRDDETREVFSISNYHMPWYVSSVYFVDVDILCYLLYSSSFSAFYCPPVMNLHVDLAARRTQQLATEVWNEIIRKDESGENDDIGSIPHILAGDFNILPDSAHYKLITTGMLDESDPTNPPMKYGAKWQPTCHPMD